MRNHFAEVPSATVAQTSNATDATAHEARRQRSHAKVALGGDLGPISQQRPSVAEEIAPTLAVTIRREYGELAPREGWRRATTGWEPWRARF